MEGRDDGVGSKATGLWVALLRSARLSVSELMVAGHDEEDEASWIRWPGKGLELDQGDSSERGWTG